MRAFKVDFSYHYVEPNFNWLDDPSYYGCSYQPKVRQTTVLAETIGEAFTKVLQEIQSRETQIHVEACAKARSEDKFPPERKEVNITKFYLEEVNGYVVQ
jgi:hypothetical protein